MCLLPPVGWTAISAVGFCCPNHWATEMQQLRPSDKNKKAILNLWSVTLLTSQFPEAMSYIFCPYIQSSKFQILTLTPGNALNSHLISFIQWVDRIKEFVTNSLGSGSYPYKLYCEILPSYSGIIAEAISMYVLYKKILYMSIVI